MKNKLNVLLAALLLSFSLLPTQSMVTSLKDFNTSLLISESGEPETPNNLKTTKFEVPQSDARIQAEDPVIIDRDH